MAGIQGAADSFPRFALPHQSALRAWIVQSIVTEPSPADDEICNPFMNQIAVLPLTSRQRIIAAVCSRCQSQRNYEFAMDSLGGLEIDHQFVLGRRLHRKVGGLLTPEDAVDRCRLPSLIDQLRAIRDQSAGPFIQLASIGYGCARGAVTFAGAIFCIEADARCSDVCV